MIFQLQTTIFTKSRPMGGFFPICRFSFSRHCEWLRIRPLPATVKRPRYTMVYSAPKRYFSALMAAIAPSEAAVTI